MGQTSDGGHDDHVVTPIADAKGKKGRGRPRRGDAWDLSNSGYDVDRFYTATVIGGDSESEKVSVRVDVNMWGRMQSLIGAGKIPAYKNSHDFMRDAMVHRMHHLSQGINDPLMEEWVRLMVRQGNLDTKNRIMESARNIVRYHQDGFAATVENQDWEMAWEMIESARDTVEELREPYASNLSVATDQFEAKVVKETQGPGDVVKVKGK